MGARGLEVHLVDDRDDGAGETQEVLDLQFFVADLARWIHHIEDNVYAIERLFDELVELLETLSFLPKEAGVSTNTSWPCGPWTMPRAGSRVVCAFGGDDGDLGPDQALSKVDLPTLERPASITKADFMGPEAETARKWNEKNRRHGRGGRRRDQCREDRDLGRTSCALNRG